MKLARTLAHALIVLAVVLVVAAFATRGFATVLKQLGFASYLPFALATAAAVNNQKGLLVATILVTILAIIPCAIAALAHALLPIGAGILLGTAVQRGMQEAREEVRHVE